MWLSSPERAAHRSTILWTGAVFALAWQSDTSSSDGEIWFATGDADGEYVFAPRVV